MENTPWSKEEFKAQLQGLSKRYHIHHPFNIAMSSGKLDREQIQGWVANRFYYQTTIPRKDAAILANCPHSDFRQLWVQRIIDHDGTPDSPGGIEAWLRLGEAVGLDRETLSSHSLLLPGVRFAVDAYFNFAQQAPWQEAACSSLTELFAPEIHKQRLATWPEHYTWVDSEGLQYFRNRVKQANRDVEHGLTITLNYFDTPELQQRAMAIVNFKLDILWSMLDSISNAYRVKL